MLRAGNLFQSNERSGRVRAGVLDQFVTGLMTDDERAAFYGLPTGCRMRENAKIYGAEHLSCGEHVWIGEDAKLDASGGLSIGSHTSIGSGTYIWSHSSLLANILRGNAPGSPLVRRLPTVIGAGCYLPGPTVVMPGVTVGDCVVALPMSVISRDVPPFTVVGGNPAKVIRKVDLEYVRSLLDALEIAEEEKARHLAAFISLKNELGDHE